MFTLSEVFLEALENELEYYIFERHRYGAPREIKENVVRDLASELFKMVKDKYDET